MQPLAIPDLIASLERRHLDGQSPPCLPIQGQLDALRWAEVVGLTRFWEREGRPAAGSGLEQPMEDLLTGLHGHNLSFGYLIVSRRDGVRVYVGADGSGANPILTSALRGLFPGIRLAETPPDRLGAALAATTIFSYRGCLTGVPTCKTLPSQERTTTAEQIERLLRGLQGESWGYFVLARPVDDGVVEQMTGRTLERVAEVSAHLKRGISLGGGASAELIDRQGQYCVDLLEKNLGRLTLGKAVGMWQVEVHFFAATDAVLNRARALLRSVFAGQDSLPEPMRTFRCVEGGAPQQDIYVSRLTSRELAVLGQLPREEFPGYAVLDDAHFDVALPPAPTAHPIRIGRVLDRGTPLDSWYAMPRDDIARHGLIVGTTGSGKTNTVFYLLDRLYEAGQGLPFLVIEPAKAEYRDLLGVTDAQGAPRFPGLQVFTLSDERYAPLRLNPFEFEIAPPAAGQSPGGEERIHVQTHIDYLKSVFNAAFVLYAPMPYVLDTCLHEVYQDKGWNLTTGTNRWLPEQEQGHEDRWPVFPTLSDLYAKIDAVVDRLGYDERIRMDVTAGLKARIGALRLGNKGLMLDADHSTSMRDLLSRPTILELERIGNDDEKAFVIGLLLTRLYEYRVVQSRLARQTPALQHVLVIEEAHRLLKNVKTEVGTEEANTRGQAVETFANILAEVRAYGQGVLIAEQIPTKLTPDVIKNTNLKVLHRMVARDDREVMAGAMNLAEAGARAVTALPPLQAAVYAEGADHPYLVEMVAYKRQFLRGRISDSQVGQVMQAVVRQPLYDPAPGYSRYLRQSGALDPRLRDQALAVLARPGFDEQFASYFLSLVVNPPSAVYGYLALQNRVAQTLGRLRPEEERNVSVAVLLHALDRLFNARVQARGWLYNVAASLRDEVTAPLVDIARAFQNDRAVLEELVGRVSRPLTEFARGYQEQMRVRKGPFPGCDFCPARCLYRPEVATLLRDPDLADEFLGVIQEARDDALLWRGLADWSHAGGQRLLPDAPERFRQEAALCLTTHMAERGGFSGASQRKVVRHVSRVLAGPVPGRPSSGGSPSAT